MRHSYEVDSGGSSNGQWMQTIKRTFGGWDFSHGVATTEQVTTSSPDDISTYQTTTSLTLDHGPRTSSWCLGRPSRQDVTKNISGSSSSTRTVQFTYDNSKCRVKTVAVGPAGDPSQQLKTTYAYLTWGQLQAVTQNDGNGSLPERKMTLTYSVWPWFRPATRSLAIAGEPDHVIGHTWNDALGSEASRTTAQQQTTSWSYDDFGRLARETLPGGLSVFTISNSGTFPGTKYKIYEWRLDGHSSYSYHDSYGRLTGSITPLPTGNGAYAYRTTTYNDLGQVASQTIPYKPGQSVYPVTYSYDLIGRLKTEVRRVSEADASNSTTSWTYDLLSTTVVDPESRTTVYTTDAVGRLIDVQAPLSGDGTYTYTPWGELSSATDAGGHQTTMTYDARGFRTQVADPDMGTWNYFYNVFGELEKVRDAKTAAPDFTSTMTYDQLGRMTQRVEAEGTTSWDFYTVLGTDKGLLEQVTHPTNASATGFQETYSYDSRARLQQTDTNINGWGYQTNFEYNNKNQLSRMIYPTTVGARPTFDYWYTKGYQTGVSQDPGSLPIYWLKGTDAAGRETSATLGSSAVDVLHDYDQVNGLLESIQSSVTSPSATLQNYTYAWDKLGNLKQRVDLEQAGVNLPNLTEDFTYDQLNRVTTVQRDSVTSLTLSYDADGNISNKSDVGSYVYNSGRPHAVSAAGASKTYDYDANGNMDDRDGATITWTSFNKPKQINASGSSCSGDCAKFQYGPNRQLIAQVTQTGGTTRTIWYIGPHFEVEIGGGVTEYRTHVMVNGSVGYSQIEDTGAGVGFEGYYPLRDHLGSVDKLHRAVGAGPDLYEYSFDAFGLRRHTDWTKDTSGSLLTANLWNHRGFTDHEQLDNVGLIHMQGRVYDPSLGRMLSPDPVMGYLDTPQLLNPYSYVMNNPLSYTDPSGYFLSGLRKFIRRLGGFLRGNVGKIAGGFIGATICAGTAGAGCALGPALSASIGSSVGSVVDHKLTGAPISVGFSIAPNPTGGFTVGPPKSTGGSIAGNAGSSGGGCTFGSGACGPSTAMSFVIIINPVTVGIAATGVGALIALVNQALNGYANEESGDDTLGVFPPIDISTPAQPPDPDDEDSGQVTDSELRARAQEIHSALPPRTQNHTTTAVTEAVNANGKVFRIISSSEPRLRPAQRALLGPNDIAAQGSGHAEVTGINFARSLGLRPIRTAVSRPICPQCAKFMEEQQVRAASPFLR